MVNLHVDVDNLWIYEEEYQVPHSYRYDLIFEQALPAMLDVFREFKASATFFVVGSDLKRSKCQEFCRRAIAEGHEIGNHTFSHPTNLHRMTYQEKKHEIVACDKTISEVTHYKPIGFRAPGYYLDHEIIDILVELGYRYDTSVLPSPVNQLMRWYISKQGGVKLDKAFGRKRYAFASRSITKIAENNGSPLFELPIATCPYIMVPIHSTFIYLLGEKYFSFIRPLLSLRSPLVYLFHAIDGLEYPMEERLSQVVLPLKISLKARLDLMRRILTTLAPQGIVTSEAMVKSLQSKNYPMSWCLTKRMAPLRKKAD